MTAKGQGADSIAADHYPTPPSLVRRYLRASPTAQAWIRSGGQWLDLCAGEGAISRVLIEEGVAPHLITALELRHECRWRLEKLGIWPVIDDATKPTARLLDACENKFVIGNPPFGLWDKLRNKYRNWPRHLALLGRAGMAFGAQDRAANWREDMPDTYGLPERAAFVRVEYRDAETGELVVAGSTDAAGHAWYEWSGGPKRIGQTSILPDAEEDGYQIPIRRIFVAGGAKLGAGKIKAAAKVASVREEWTPPVWPGKG